MQPALRGDNMLRLPLLVDTSRRGGL